MNVVFADKKAQQPIYPLKIDVMLPIVYLMACDIMCLAVGTSKRSKQTHTPWHMWPYCNFIKHGLKFIHAHRRLYNLFNHHIQWWVHCCYIPRTRGGMSMGLWPCGTRGLIPCGNHLHCSLHSRRNWCQLLFQFDDSKIWKNIKIMKVHLMTEDFIATWGD